MQSSDAPSSIWVFFRDDSGRLSVLRRRAGAKADDWQASRIESAAMPRNAPAAAAWKGDRLAVVHQSAGGELVWRRWRDTDPGWSAAAAGAEPIGGRSASSPSVVAVGENADELFLAYADEQRLPTLRRWTDGCWGDEERLSERPVAPYSGPTVTALPNGECAIFYLGRDGEGEFPRLFWRRWQGVEGWTAEETVAEVGHLTRGPGALPTATGLDLYYWRAGVGVETQGLFVRGWSRSRGWSTESRAFESILDSSPSVVRCSNGVVRIFFVGPGRSLQCRRRGAAGAWGDEARLADRLTSDPVACAIVGA